MTDKVKVGIIQMRCSEDKAENVRRASDFVREAASRGAQIICLPELFLSPYFCKVEDHRFFALAEPIPAGESSRHFEDLARELDVTLIASFFEKRAEGLYHNTAAIFDGARGYAGKYRKMHIPDDPLFYEKFYFTPGDLGFKAFDTPSGKIGTLICWDQWYPEAARLTVLRGANILFYPTAIGWLPAEKEAHGASQHGAWELSQRAHAVANGCFVVSVNRIGFEPAPAGSGDVEGIEFWGQSFIVGPDGQFIARASSDREEVIVETLDLARIDQIRTEWPFFRDRRIDAYHDITRRFIDED
jgi:N-carbamoylputrescine amidase